jgi:hypothetical protein
MFTATPLPTLGPPVNVHGAWLLALLVVIPFVPPL